MRSTGTFGQVLLESRWPRAELGGADIVTGECLGRFAGHGDSWRFEPAAPGKEASGTGDILDNVARLLREIGSTHPKAGMVGYFTYEFGYRLLGLPEPTHQGTGFQVPTVQFLVFDSLSSRAARIGNTDYPGQSRSYTRTDLERIAEQSGVYPNTNRAEYEEGVKRIKTHIREGDIYQANLTQAFDIRTDRDGFEIYQALRQINPAPFSAYLRFDPVRLAGLTFPQLEILSCSPERFWRKQGRRIETRPIKGTIGRGHSPVEDRLRIRSLLSSAKDRAELLMITDLLRNDIGRCAEVGSVRTRCLRRARACASVWHLESVVTGLVPSSAGWQDVMRNLLPGGSITGAPKRRAVEILSGLERVPRGVYCGAVGWVDTAGDCDFALPIRTAVKSGNLTRVFGGGGIVADSDAASEYEESLLKIAPIIECLCGNASAGMEEVKLYAQESVVPA